MDETAARAERARLRAARITVAVVRPGEVAPPEEIVTGARGLALATHLSTLAFAMAGQDVATVPRAQWPIRIHRVSDDE